ncbi:hypothetical protein HC891_07040 [Candidatus Gracilibacteria bacterium]|nr:hypothetical protein [Candidatus Gracilibacteria bacterium]
MMKTLISLGLASIGAVALWRWYEHETLREGEGVVHLQSEHDHFHMHVDLPAGMEVQPGDTLEIVSLPNTEGGRTRGEISYPSRVRLYKASWLRRNVVKQSGIAEVNELVEHP